MVRRYSRRFRGSGYQTPQQFFTPDVLPPHTEGPFPSTEPTAEALRPILHSTMKVGGRRRRSTRRVKRGGFSPSVMGSFIQNAQSAVVPLALFSAYHFMPKKGRNIASVRKSSRSRRH